MFQTFVTCPSSKHGSSTKRNNFQKILTSDFSDGGLINIRGAQSKDVYSNRGRVMVRAVFDNDLKFMKKDPMMWAVVFMPIGMITFYHVVIRLLPFMIDYSKLLQYLFIAMAGTMPGAILGLRVLDEKDEHLLPYFAVTPMTLKGYYGYRAVASFILSIIEVGLVSIGVQAGIHATSILYGALLGVMMTFITGGVAKNKVQGMVFLKLFGVVVLLPCIRLLGENRYDRIIHLIPWDYMYMHFDSAHLTVPITLAYFGYVFVIIGVFYHQAVRE